MSGSSLKEQQTNAQLRYEIACLRRATAMMEALPSFAADPDEKDWVVLGGSAKEPYTESSLTDMRTSARKLQYTAAGRGVLQTLQDFIVGKSATVNASDEDPKVQDYWNAWSKANKWDSRSKEIVRRTFRDGEIFLRWFPPQDRDGILRVRFLEPGEIKAALNGKPSFGIETDPDDIETVLSYHREYSVDGTLQVPEDIPAEDVDHLKILVDSDIKRGVSFFTGISKYMKEYELWLRDRIALNKVRHIWNIVGKPTSPQVPLTDVMDKFTDQTADAPVGGTKKKKVPRVGSVLFNRGIEWDLKSLNINASDTKDDGRAIQLMIAIGTCFPEYIARGDSSNANYASTMISESPFVRSMESWQDVFGGEDGFFGTIFARVIADGIARGRIPPQSTKTTVTWDPVTKQDKTEEEKVPTSTECTVNFATLITRNIKEETEAVQIHVQNGWCSSRTAAEKLDYDYEAEQDQINRETNAEPDTDHDVPAPDFDTED